MRALFFTGATLCLCLHPSFARADRSQDLKLVGQAKQILEMGPRLSRGFGRSARGLVQRAARGGQLFYYAPLARRGGITVFDSRRTSSGFVASSLTVTRTTPRSGAWDVQMIREDSGRRVRDVARAAKKLPGGNVLEVRYVAGARGKGLGSFALLDPAGKTLARGGLKQLHAAPLGIPARQVKALLTHFAPFGL